VKSSNRSKGQREATKTARMTAGGGDATTWMASGEGWYVAVKDGRYIAGKDGQKRRRIVCHTPVIQLSTSERIGAVRRIQYLVSASGTR